jgi:acyl-CoA synthetase (AMP-forming)/AMP-acid ligase II
METLKDVLIENSRYANKGLTFIDNNNDEFVSYKSLFEKSVKVLGALQNAGVKKGDELVFQIETNQEFVYVFWACILGGIIPVPVAVGNNDEHRHKIFRIWKYLNNPFLITDDKTIKNLERFSSEYKLESIKEIMGRTLMTDYIISDDTYNGIIENVEPDDIGYIQFSSGSTGDPKGVVLTHYNLMTSTRDILASSGTTQDDSLLAWVPLTHDMGLILFHLTGVVGGINEYMMLTKVFVQSPTIWIRKTNQYRATQLYSPNFGYKYFMSFLDESEQYDWDLSCVRIIWNGAEPISSKICEEFLSTMSRFKLSKEVMFPVYGMAEACVIATTPSLGQLYKCVSVDRNSLGIGSTVIEVKEGSENSVQLVEEGSCVANTRMRICDDKDNELPEMTVGHIQLKGENITSGYYNNAEATSKAFTADGWLRTGDLGFIKEGRIVVTGRAKEIIFVNGQNIYPYDIERIAESVGGIELGKIAACGVYINSNEKEEIVLFVYYKRKLSGFLRLEKELKQVVAQKMGLTVLM